MKVNVLMEIRADFAWPADDPADDTELQAKNRETLALCGDLTSIPNIFATRIAGGNWQVYSMLYDMPTWPEIEQAVELFKSENPGQTGVLGAWEWTDEIASKQVGTDLVIDTRTVSKTWSEINPDYQPDDQEPNYDPNFVIRVTGDVEEEYVSGSTGVPVYPIPGYFSQFMPDGDATVRDVNLYAGQPPRSFV